MASGLFSSIQSLSTQLLEAIRGTPSTSHHRDPPVTDQHKSVREDLEKLSRMLRRIQAILKDAEEREIHDESVQLWLAELRGVGYQAEDVLDEFYYEVLRSIVERGDAAIEAYHRDGGTKRKFAEMDTSSSIASYSFSITKVVIPDGMAEKIKGITEMFEEISNARRDLHLREDDGTRLVKGTQIRPPTSSHVDERAIFGREKEKEKIISVLNPLNDPQFTVLPIIGMGGLGKTTLAQLVYNDSKFLQLFDKRAWVSVSENFDLVCLTRAIIESINRITCEISELNTLQDILKEMIKHASLFLVLDDVWNENTELWEHFQVALKGVKTVKILTTTRNTTVAEIMQTTSPIQLDYLPNGICWSLFKHFAFNNGEASENGKLLEIGYDIVKKCRGSPLVTKVLGGILRYDMDEEKWLEVLESDISEVDESGKIFTPLELSYQKLPLHLKPCFVYLAMFPKGKRIDRDHVVRLWMAQGYINSNSSRTKKTLEEIGSEYLNELQGRSLIDFGYYNKCYVHDLIHDLARSISQRTNQPVLENDNLWHSSYKINHLYLTKKHELSGVLASCNNKVIRTYIRECPRNFEDISMGYPRNYIDDSAIFSKITYVRALELGNCMLPDTLNMLKHLRYLSIEDDRIESLPESLCLLYHLQTLDISCHILLELPENIKSLINLRFLRLCSGKIEQLPESISLLHNLDTLSIDICHKLTKLPRTIEQLTNLRVLKLSEHFICNLSSGIGKLTNLETLTGHFKVMGSDMTRGLGELRDMMNRLSGSMSISGLKNVGNIECSKKANLVSKSNLSKLILNFEENDVCKRFLGDEYKDPLFCIAVSSSTNAKNENDKKIEGVLENLQPHGNLTQLVILNYGGRRVPSWLLHPSLMSNLITLTLHFHSELTFLPFLQPLWGQLLHLKYLKICGSGDTSRKLCEGPSFNNMLNLGEWKTGDKPCLKKLVINNCPEVWKVTIPENVDVLEVNECGCQEIEFSSHSELKRLSLSGCPNLFMLSTNPLKLKQLDIKYCGFQEINLSSLSNLQKISIFSCRELVSIYYKIGDLPSLVNISLSGCPKLLIFSAILDEMKQMDKRNSGFQSEIQNIFDYREFMPLSRGRVSLSNCPKLRIFSAIPAVELNKMEIINCGISEIILPSRCKLLVIHNCPQLKLLKIPKEVEVLQIKSCSIREIFFSLQSKVRSVHIYDCPELFLVHWMNRNVLFLKDLVFEGCPELISLQFLQEDLPLLEKFTIKSCPQFHEVLTIPYQLKELTIIDCRFPEIYILPQSKLQRLIIRECSNLTAIKGLQAQFPPGDVSHPTMEMVKIHNCPMMDFGTNGNSYFYD
ncbi:disease resistance protein RGA2-like [Carex rostrata]